MRRYVIRAGLVAALVSLAVLLTFLRFPALTDDFMAYWSAAQILATGANPYDPAGLLAVQQSQGWRYSIPLPTLYGPWILAASVPISLLPYWPARVGWMVVQVSCLLASAALLWRLYGGSSASRGAFLLVATFAPAILSVAEGQITPLALLGLAAFLFWERRHSDWFAGAALFPLTAKPLALYLLWPALMLWLLRSRRWRILAGLFISVAVGTGIAFLLNPSVFVQWLDFYIKYSPLSQDYTPTIGSVLRYLLGVDRYWLAFMAAVAGLVWLAAYWRRSQSAWNWTEQLPLLAFASVLTAPFVWSHDALLLLPVVLQAAARRWTSVDSALWLPLNAAALAVYPYLRLNQVWYLLYFLALIAWFLWHTTPGLGIRRRSPFESIGSQTTG